MVSQELFEYFARKYGVKEEDNYKSIYRTKVSLPKFSYQKFAVSDLYSFASAEEVRLVVKVPLEKNLDKLPDRVLVFDEEGKCGNAGGPPPPPPPPGGPAALPPALPKSIMQP